MVLRWMTHRQVLSSISDAVLVVAVIRAKWSQKGTQSMETWRTWAEELLSYYCLPLEGEGHFNIALQEIFMTRSIWTFTRGFPLYEPAQGFILVKGGFSFQSLLVWGSDLGSCYRDLGVLLTSKRIMCFSVLPDWTSNSFYICVLGDFRSVSDRAAGGRICRGRNVRTSCRHQKKSAEDQDLPEQ